VAPGGGKPINPNSVQAAPALRASVRHYPVSLSQACDTPLQHSANLKCTLLMLSNLCSCNICHMSYEER
jgi:hypothetical protein